MAQLVAHQWESRVESGLSRRDRRHGPYRSYVPDTLVGRPLTVGPELSRSIARAERAVRALEDGPGGHELEQISRFLLRSEAIASSLIEGIAPSPQQVALAELAQDEPVRGFSEQARLVANNITIVRAATNELATADAASVDDVVRLHASLLPDERHHGLRTVQNWIGGSSWHPLEADFVPPPADSVPRLVEDLVSYLNASPHAPIVHAALVHAQFETIHPFTDGNGRVGRSLIHTVLVRRGLTRRAILPVSLVLSTLRDRYVDGLTAYRFMGDATSELAQEGTGRWLKTFVDATLVAVEQARKLADDVLTIRREWEEGLARHRTSHGLRPTPRAGSATALLLAALPEAPIVTAQTVQRLLDVSNPAARSALEELADAGVLTRKSVNRGTTAYLATDVFTLLGHTERRLASTQFDTRAAAPSRAVPAAPQ